MNSLILSMFRRISLSFAGFFVFALFCIPSFAYPPNFVWNRSLDWDPGTVAGTSLGNADDDALGNAVWRYGTLTGGDFSSINPWYRGQIELSVWDDVWWGASGTGAWARNYFGPDVDNDNANPPIGRYAMWHDLSERTHSFKYTSAVDWLNPVGNGATVNISGNLVFLWQGHFATASPIGALEAVVTKFDSSTGEFFNLWTGSFTNPTVGAGLTPASQVVAPIRIVGLRLDEGDFIRYTFRASGDESAVPLWMGMRDEVSMRLVSVVPEPSSLLLIFVGLVCLVTTVFKGQVSSLVGR